MAITVQVNLIQQLQSDIEVHAELVELVQLVEIFRFYQIWQFYIKNCLDLANFINNYYWHDMKNKQDWTNILLWGNGWPVLHGTPAFGRF